MAALVVCGGSVIGLLSAVLLAEDGHDVTVLERDPDEAPGTPEDAWSSWSRSGVAQFRQPHNLFARFREICDTELPGLTDRLLAAGCVWVDFLSVMPPSIPAHDPRPGDDRLPFVTGRRPVVEAAVAAMAQEHPRVTVRRGVTVDHLVAGREVIAGVPHVAGVRTTTGETVTADLVVDATGRRAPGAGWLEALGASRPHTESADSGFTYYTRYFTGPHRPPRRTGALMPFGSFSLLTLDGDNDTWSVTVFSQSGDQPLKALRHNDTYTRVIAACPLQAHWLDGTPITDVLPMAGILDAYHRYVVDDQPVVTGYAAVGDAWACTNPSAGRGVSVGLIHAQVLRDVCRSHLDQPAAFARAWDEQTETRATPYFRNQLAADRHRLAEMAAAREGRPPPAPDPTTARFMATAMTDPDVYRALLRTTLCLELPQDVVRRPEVAAALDRADLTAPPPAPPGPDRAELLRLLEA